MAAASFDDSAYLKLFPPNSIVHLILEVARCKKIFQHEDNARTTSCFVETFFANAPQLVGKGWLPGGDVAAEAEKELVKTPRKGKSAPTPPWDAPETKAPSSLVGQTKTVTESSDPFFNHPFEFVFNPRDDGIDQNSVALFHFRVCDANYDPARPISLSTAAINFTKNGAKGEITLNPVLDPELAKAAAATESFERTKMTEVSSWPEAETCLENNNNNNNATGGTLVIRYSVKISKPKPPVRDPEADVELAEKPKKLAGENPVLEIPQQGYGLHTVLPGLVLFTDPDFTLKLNKAMIKILGGLFDEENAASRSPKRKGGAMGSSMMMASTRKGASSELAATSDTIDKVILGYWKCKRSHQVHTKVRLAAERCLRHEQVLSFSAEEEMEWKIWYKQQAAILEVGVTNPQLENLSSSLRLMYDKIWVLMACGDDETESGSLWTPNFEQRTKLQYTAWGPTQYAALQAAFIKLVLPTLSDKAALEIGVEDFKADEAAQDAMVPLPGSSRVIGSGMNASVSAPLGKSQMMNRSTTNNNNKSSNNTEKEMTLAEFSELVTPLEKQYAPVRGDSAFKLFVRQLSDFIHRWQATMTETEQITMLKGCVGVIQNVARPYSGFQAEKEKRSKKSASTKK
jgi:hypothetical protein